MFRFSLRTLVLVALWCGAAMWVWRSRKPWALTQSRVDNASTSAETYPWSVLLPDRTRVARVTFLPMPERIDTKGTGYMTRVEIRDFYQRSAPLCNIDIQAAARNIYFRDDNTLDCTGALNCIYQRRFPEWWWGHFYRPEVWLLIVLSLALIVTFVRHLRKWRRAGRV